MAVEFDDCSMSHSSERSAAAEVPGSGVDKAYEYLKNHEKNASVSPAGLRAIRRKVDVRIVPLLFFTYFLQFLDKVAYNVSSTN